MSTCSSCNTALLADDTFCGECGAKVADQSPVPLPSAVPATWATIPESSVPTRSAPPGPGAFNGSTGKPTKSQSEAVIRIPSVAVAILVSLPMVILSLYLVFSIAGIFLLTGPQLLFWLIMGSWVVAGLLLLIPGIEQRLAWPLFRLRPPTAEEWDALGSSWEAVCHAANVNPERFLVRVQDTKQINALAAGGSLVGVTRFALTLPGDQLSGVLAHELGHHAHGHARVGIVLWWYTLPIRLLFAIAKGVIQAAIKQPIIIAIAIILIIAVVTIVTAINSVVGMFNGVANSLSMGMLGGGRSAGQAAEEGAASGAFIGLIIVYGIPLLVLFAGPYVVAWLSRWQELQADRFALGLNYGQPLLDLFRRWQAEGHDDAQTTTGLRLLALSSHPPVWKRIIQAENYLDQQ